MDDKVEFYGGLAALAARQEASLNFTLFNVIVTLVGLFGVITPRRKRFGKLRTDLAFLVASWVLLLGGFWLIGGKLISTIHF